MNAMGSLVRSARRLELSWWASSCRISPRFFTSSSRMSEQEEEKSSAPASDDPKPPAPLEEFPSIQLSQKSPVLLKRIGKMTNNRAIQDFKRRLCVAKYENERMQYKAACHDRNLPLEIRRYFESKLNSLPRNSSVTRVRNRCIITGRGRSVYRKFRMSRICLREMAGRGELMGLYKASW